MRTLLVLTAILLTELNFVYAQQAPALGYVYPPVVQVGQTTSVQLGGYDFTPDLEFFLHSKSAKLNITGEAGELIVPPPPYWFGEKGSTTAFLIPSEFPATLTIPANHPLGTVQWQVANANGASKTTCFLVSRDQPLLEKRDREFPQVVPQLPMGICGRISKIAEVDRYQITPEKSGPVTIQLMARQLGADWNAVIRVTNAAGKIVADVADTEGFDCALTFAANAGETYTVQLHDLDYRGNQAFVYYLSLTPGPRVLATIPAAGQRGETREVTFLGIGLKTGSDQLESIKQQVTFSSDPAQQVQSFTLKTAHGDAPPIQIPLSDLKELSAPQKTELSAGSAVTKTMPDSGIQKFQLKAAKGERWEFTAESHRLGTGMDLSLAVHNAEGKRLATNDDLPGTLDTGVSFVASADGVYTVTVNDLSGRGGLPTSVYRLASETSQPGFSLSTTQQLKLPIAGTASLKLTAKLVGGFKEEITLNVQGLPKGVTVPEELKIPAGKTTATITFTAAENCATIAKMISITASAKIGEETITETLTVPLEGNLCPRDPAQEQTTEILLATTMKPAYTVEIIDRNRQRAVHRGTTYPAPLQIKREEGFTGPVRIQMISKQSRHRQGITGPIVVVPPESGDALYPCFLPEWLETDRTTRMVVLGVAVQNDPTGKPRHITQPANARITMILEGALLKVSHQAGELSVKPGESFSVPVEIFRSIKFQTDVKLNLVTPPELAGLVECEPVELSVDQRTHTLTIQTKAATELNGRWPLQIRASAVKDGKWPVISLTDFVVDFGNAP